MIRIPGMILVVALCFVAAILNLAAKFRWYRLFTRVALVLTALIGAACYGYGFVYTTGFTAQALFRALLAMCRMFAGINDFSAVQAAPLFSSPVVLAVFWLGHFLGFYVTASATVSALGEQLLRRIRVLLLRRGPLLLIYGVQSNSIAFGRYMAQKEHRPVLYVDPENTAQEDVVREFGAVLERKEDALNPNGHFLRRIGMNRKGRPLEIALLHPSGRKNLAYARALGEALSHDKVPSGQISLLISGVSGRDKELSTLDRSVFSSVYAFDDYELTARMIIRHFPPCDSISFDREGRAEEDYHAVILGFGRMGSAVLRHLIMNGQFVGSSFRADIFDTAPQNGFLLDHPMLSGYDIRFHSAGGRSGEFYAFLEQNADRISTIILCTGSTEENAEIADDLAAWFHRDAGRPCFILASRESVVGLNASGDEIVRERIYDSDVLSVRRMDAEAMQINAAWAHDPEGVLHAWQRCDHFSRMSCRAAADFYPAFLRAAHTTEEAVLAGEWPPAPPILENLAQTEHLRWCAFHTVMGYRPMPAKEWESRAERLKQNPSLSVGKDPEKRLHACLTSWEDLRALAEKENAVTGRNVDYQEMDRENVRTVAEILKARRQFEKEMES